MSDQPYTPSNKKPLWSVVGDRKLGKKIRVLVVDDSALVRKVLSTELANDPAIEVMGVASDPYIARDKIVADKPDVITLDVEMPRMDGITFLEKLMVHYPVPVVIFSSLTDRMCQLTLRALEVGAVDVMLKPAVGGGVGLSAAVRELAGKIKVASTARLTALKPRPKTSKPKLASSALLKTTETIVAVGASTGGTKALADVLEKMPADGPAMVIVQHMPEAFTKSFAQRLNSISAMEVREAKDNDTVRQCLALLAPGGSHMMLRRSGARYYVKLTKGPPIFHQRPSVEVLFRSVAQYAGSNSVGVIMTGMGADGAGGMLDMREAGAHTIAQDEKSCVVYGMPKEAVQKGGVIEVTSLHNIPGSILKSIAA